MLKLKHKLEHSINIGIDYLLRKVELDKGLSEDLYDHCTATYCISENPRNQADKVQQALNWVSQFTYSTKNSFFIIDEQKQSLTKTNTTAALAYLSFENMDWSKRFGQTVLDRQNDTGFIAYDDQDSVPIDNDHISQAVKLFVLLYGLTKDDKWLQKAKLSRDWILTQEPGCNNRNINEPGCNHWNIIAIKSLDDAEQKSKKWISDAVEVYADDLDILAAYGDAFGGNWDNKIKELCYARLDKQIEPSNPWKCGAFVDEDNNIRIDWSEKYISTFKRILAVVDKRV